MKLLTYKLQGDEKERLGVMCANAFQRFYPLETFGLHFQDMNDLIEHIISNRRRWICCGVL